MTKRTATFSVEIILDDLPSKTERAIVAKTVLTSMGIKRALVRGLAATWTDEAELREPNVLNYVKIRVAEHDVD